MKHLRETFTDEEFEKLQKSKRDSELNWHDFILMTRWFYEKHAQIVSSLKCGQCKTALIHVESFDGHDRKYTCWKCGHEQWE